MGSVFALLLAVLAARAGEPTPTDAPSPSARAFLAFSEADRKAAQEALGWLGFYNGVDDGAFGKRTAEALKAYQQSLAAAPDGILTAELLTRLEAGAASAKAAVGFALVDDPGTGSRIGAPMKLVRKVQGGGFAFVSKDSTVQLALTKAEGDLAALFHSLSAPGPQTQLTYKALKPGVFFVIAGEEGEAKFYTRYAADGDKLRGFTFKYPKSRAKTLDPVALAIANSFQPFPAPPKPLPPGPAPKPLAPGPRLAATALIVAPGVAVTALDAGACAKPEIAGKPARFLSPEGALVRLGGDFGAGAKAPPVGAGGGDLLALSLADAGLKAAPARALGTGHIVAALDPSASGAPLFDRHGRLVALVAAISAAPMRDGVALAAPHATTPVAELGASVPAPEGADLTAAEIAKLRRAAIIGVFCAS